MVYQWSCDKCKSYNIYVEKCSECGHDQPRGGTYITTFEERNDKTTK